jgi:hypothetical protein
MNTDNLIRVTAQGRKTNIDLRYLEGQDRWQVSDQVFETLDLSENGFNVYVNEGEIVLSSQSIDESDYMKGSKVNAFTANGWRTLFDNLGHEGENDFALSIEHQEDGITYLSVEPWGDRVTSDMSPLNFEQTQDTDQQEEVINVEEESNRYFAE